MPSYLARNGYGKTGRDRSNVALVVPVVGDDLSHDRARDWWRRTLSEPGSTAERLYRRRGWQLVGTVDDYAAMPDGRLAPTTFMTKHL